MAAANASTIRSVRVCTSSVLSSWAKKIPATAAMLQPSIQATIDA